MFLMRRVGCVARGRFRSSSFFFGLVVATGWWEGRLSADVPPLLKECWAVV